MRFINKIITWYIEKEKVRNNLCYNYIIQVDIALEELESLFKDELAFIDLNKVMEWRDKNELLLANIEIQNLNKLKKAEHFKILLQKQEKLFAEVNSLKDRIRKHNKEVEELQIQNAYNLIGKVEGRMLDKQQITCIIKDNHNHLVIAGAGTGKTTTIVGKIKFLIKSGKYDPRDILVLSFTNASANEMKERITKETGCNIDVFTFHKLGLNIIASSSGVIPKISQLNLHNFIKEQLLLNMKSDEYLNLLSNYLVYNRVIAKSEFDFQSQSEYDDYLKLNPPTTINKEKVKSYGEMDIANFLNQNGIKYLYEQPYKIDTRTSEYGQYIPDFYLPDYDIYIEYFGINRNGDVPAYFRTAKDLNPTQSYQASMNWKRGIHNINNTKMIECYAYEKFDGVLLENLKNNLIVNSVEFNPKTTMELWKEVSNNELFILDGVIELFETIINLMKSNSYTIEMVYKLSLENNMQDNNIILSLLEPIYNAYEGYLKKNNEIDFNDMINIATDFVQQKKYISPYKCVIVDEYQDISKSRYSLISSMRKSNDYDLFCVGDDWQSIYRFAGSDIGFILNFDYYWGHSYISKIETTYRFSEELIGITGDFIMQNPLQIKKTIKGNSDNIGFPLGEIRGYQDKYAIEFMINKISDLPKDSTVFFIGRYSVDVKLLIDSGVLDCKYNNISGLNDIKYNEREDLKMSFMTAHKSKGLQADYVFIINNKKSRMGFPSKIQEAPILKLLLDNYEEYPYAEERRLFYVAMTRAKKKVYIVTINNQESEFVIELKKRYGEEISKERFECPECGGNLIKINGIYGDFFGCENYKINGCTYKRKIK